MHYRRIQEEEWHQLQCHRREGEISTANVSARFVEGKPVGLLVRHEMKSPGEWDRFMRFMERYAEANGLGFAKA